jgi:hypothetical protein
MEAFAAAAGGGLFAGSCIGFSLFGFGSRSGGIVLGGTIVLIETPYLAKNQNYQ